MKQGKAVVVGGSIAGMSCAHALAAAGWEVVVLEKTMSAPTSCTTGAGLGLDKLSLKIIQPWLKQPETLDLMTLPLTVEYDQATDVSKNISRTLARDPSFNFKVVHWSDLHRLLYESLPPEVVLLWGHFFLSLSISEDKSSVKVVAKLLQTDETVEIVADLLVAADGSLSPELVKVMRETKDPFLNAIYDSEPLEHFYWNNNVVLIGDAAHPITPHSARATNMAILDAAVLGKCLEKWGPQNLGSALEEYQSIRLPVAKEQVLYSRRSGRIKQRLTVSGRELFDPMTASEEESKVLQIRNTPYFNVMPSILM